MEIILHIFKCLNFLLDAQKNGKFELIAEVSNQE